MIFADTSALIALFSPRDDCHSNASEWFKENRPKLVLTDYIVDELLTLAIARGDK
jgi:predicted nucleic acid-binding protein